MLILCAEFVASLSARLNKKIASMTQHWKRNSKILIVNVCKHFPEYERITNEVKTNIKLNACLFFSLFVHHAMWKGTETIFTMTAITLPVFVSHSKCLETFSGDSFATKTKHGSSQPK